MVDDNEGSRAGRGRTDLPKTEPSKAEAMSFEIVRKVVSEVFEERADENSGSRPGRGRANLPMIQPNEVRLMFFETVRQLKPEVFEELAGEPFRVFKRMSVAEWDTARVSVVSDRWECRGDPTGPQAQSEFENALVEFALQQPTRFTLSSIEEHFQLRHVDPQEAIDRLVDKGVFQRVEFDPHRLEWATDTQKKAHREIVLWMSRWNLDAPWCFVFAFHTLSRWRRNPDDAMELLLDTHFEDSTPLNELSFKVEFKDPFSDLWWPSEETKTEARERLTKKSKEATEEYLRQVEKRTADWLPRSKVTERHLAMFVWYQVLNHSESELAEDFGVTQPRASQIIGRISGVVGLTPRPPKPAGRPETPRGDPT